MILQHERQAAISQHAEGQTPEVSRHCLQQLLGENEQPHPAETAEHRRALDGLDMTFRSRALLDLIHDMPCMATFPHDCNDSNGCEPMHSDHHLFGRGMGHKSADFAVAAGCHNAHRILTAKVGDELTREQKFYDWMRAYVKTWEWLWTNRKVRIT